MSYPNRHGGKCHACSDYVAAQTGFVLRGAGGLWIVQCKPCAAKGRGGAQAAAASAGPPAVAVSLLPSGEVAIRPTSRLGEALFAVYRDACAGARYDKAAGVNVVAGDRAIRVLARLRDAGFSVTGGEEVRAALADIAAQGDAARADASARADEIDRTLRARGLGLYGFQRAGVGWLASRSAGLLADDMGLGKTIQCLAAIPPGPVLVICPSVAKGVWVREAAKWRPDLTPVLLAGRGSFRWPAPGEMVVTNFDVLPVPDASTSFDEDDPEARAKAAKLAKKRETHGVLPPGCPPGTTMVVDEAHACKSTKADRTQRVRSISNAVRKNAGRVYLLTATPLLNRPPELWAVLQAADLGSEAFGGWQGFVHAFNGTPGRHGGYDWGQPRADVPERLSRVMLRRVKRDVLPDLPAKRWADIPVDLDTKTARECDALLTLLGGETFEIPRGNRVAFEKLSRVRSLLAAAKIPAMLDIVAEYEEANEPLVVMSAHRSPIDTLGARPGWATITGDTSPPERTRIEAAFQAGALRGVACTIEAGGVAITLTRASNMLFVDLDWTPSLNDQAEDRVYRIGQDRGVLIMRLVAANAVDRRLRALLAGKVQLIGASVEAAATMSAPAPVAVPELGALPPPTEPEPEAPRQMLLDGVPVDPRVLVAPREASNDVERWAIDGVCTLAAHDPDMATTINGVGFSKMDGSFGHSLASAYSESGGKLTPRQWSAVVALARKYRRQCGEEPRRSEAS
jgi:hypothetical protein